MKKQSLRILIGAYLGAILCTSITPLSLVLDSMAKQFPDASAASVQFVYTLATGSGLIGSLVVGFLSSRFTKKTLFCGCMLLAALGGVLGFVGYTSMALLLVTSLIVGAAIGASDPLGTALISESFDGNERARWNGFKSVIVSVGGILCTFVGGMLAAGNWQNIYLLYVSAAVFFVALLILLPGGGQTSHSQEAGGKTPLKKLLNPMVCQLYLINFLMSICWVVYNSNVSFLLEGNTEQSSFVTIVFMVAMTVAGFFVELQKKCFKEYAMPVNLALVAVSLWIFTQCQGSVALLVTGAAVLGFGFCSYTALCFTSLPEYATAGLVTQTISFFSAISTSGSLIHPYVITVPAALFGPSVMNRFYLCAVIMTVTTVYGFVLMAKCSKKET